MEKYTPGMALRHPDGKVYSNNTLVAFVDDTSMGVTQEGIQEFKPLDYWPVQPQATMHAQLEANIGFYGHTLESTGGALAWERCKAYLIMFLWIDGIKIIVNNKNDFPPLRVFSLLTGMYHFIKIANPDEAFRMLGAFVAPNGCMKKQIKILTEIAQKWAWKISKSYLTPHESLIAFKQVLFPALVYPQAVMPLTEKDCDNIIRPALNALLKKLHFPKTTCRKLLYGPARYGGMELPNLCVHGNVLKLMMLIGHLQKEDVTMPIIRTSLGKVQQQTGISLPALESNFSKYEILVETCWVKHVWKFLHEINGRLSVEGAWMPQPPHKNDDMLMDKVMEISLPTKTLQQFNLCRLQKRSYFLRDMLDSKQKGLHPMILHPNYQRETFEKFPRIILPKQNWKEWEQIIKTLHCSSRVSAFHAGLAKQKQSIMWLQRRDRKILLHQTQPNTYRVFKLSKSGRNKYLYDKATWHETDIYDTTSYYNVSVAHLTHIIETDGYDETLLPYREIKPQTDSIFHLAQRFNGWVQQHLRRQAPVQPKTSWDISISEHVHDQLHRADVREFLSAIETLPAVLKRNLGGIQEITDLPKLAQSIEMHKSLAVADASIESRGRASHAYILESRCGRYKVIGVAPVDCDEDNLDSTRAELWGQVAIQTIINLIFEQFGVISGRVEVYGDNKDSLVKQHMIPSKMAFPRYFRPNVDAKLLLQRLRADSPKAVELLPEHMKGHQDDNPNVEYETAPQPVKRNIDMDHLSKEFLKTNQGILEPCQIQKCIPGQKATLILGDKPINNTIHHHVNLQFYGHDLEKRFRQKIDIPVLYQKLIQWKAFERAYQGTSEQDKLSRFNLVHGKWQTNMARAKWDCSKNPHCQRCCDREETVMHVFLCTSSHAGEIFKKSLADLKKSLQKANTAPLITSAFESIFLSARKGYMVKLPENKLLIYQKFPTCIETIGLVFQFLLW